MIRPVTANEAPPLRLCTDPDNLPFSSASTVTPGFYVELGGEIALGGAAICLRR